MEFVIDRIFVRQLFKEDVVIFNFGIDLNVQRLMEYVYHNCYPIFNCTVSVQLFKLVYHVFNAIFKG